MAPANLRIARTIILRFSPLLALRSPLGLRGRRHGRKSRVRSDETARLHPSNISQKSPPAAWCPCDSLPIVTGSLQPGISMLLHDPHRAGRQRRHHGTSLFRLSGQILTSGLRAPLAYPSTPEGSVDRRLHIGILSTYLHKPEMEEGSRKALDSPDEPARRQIEKPRSWSRGGRAGGRPPSSRRKARTTQRMELQRNFVWWVRLRRTQKSEVPW